MTTIAAAMAHLNVSAAVKRFLLDRVVLAIAAVTALLAVLDWPRAGESIAFMITQLVEIAPFLALAIGFAAFAKASGADALIARAFSGGARTAIILAAVTGAMSPFCSCGVIPLIAAMLGAGVPLAPVMAFWIASPVMDPEMFILTAAGIGVNFAIVKTLAAAAMGLLAGFSVYGLQRIGYLADPLSANRQTSCAVRFDAGQPVHVQWRFWRSPHGRAVFNGELATSGWFLGKWLALAFLLESIMIAYVDPGWIIAIAGANNPVAIPATALVGMPSYLNGYAAIPLVAGLLDLGMTPGAAMAFMTAGAVSSVPAAIAVYALVRRAVFFTYLLLGLTGAIMTAYLFQLSGVGL